CTNITLLRVTLTGSDAQFVINLPDMNPGVVRVDVINCTILNMAEVVLLGWSTTYVSVLTHQLTINIDGVRADVAGFGFSLGFPVGTAIVINNSVFTHTNVARTHYALPSGDYNGIGVNIATYNLQLNGSSFAIVNSNLTTRSSTNVVLSTSTGLTNGSMFLILNSTLSSTTYGVYASGSTSLNNLSAVVFRQCYIVGTIDFVVADLYLLSSFNVIDVVFVPTDSQPNSLVFDTRLTLNSASVLRLIRYTHWYNGGTSVARLATFSVPNGTVVVVGFQATAASRFWYISNPLSSTTMQVVVGCSFYNNVASPTTLSGWGIAASTVQACSTCVADATCFMPNTIAFNATTCTCTCAPGAKPPDCLPYPLDIPSAYPAVYQGTIFSNNTWTLAATHQSLTFINVVFSNTSATLGSQHHLDITSMAQGNVTITIQDSMITGGSVVYFNGGFVAVNPLQTVTILIRNVTVTQGVLVFLGKFTGSSSISITNSSFLNNVAPPTPTMSWLVDTTISSLNAADVLRLASYRASIVIYTVTLDTLSSFVLANSTLTADGFSISSTTTASTASPIATIGSLTLSTSASFVITGCVLQAWTPFIGTAAASSIFIWSAVQLTAGSVLAIVGTYATAPVYTESSIAVAASSIVAFHGVVIGNTYFESLPVSAMSPIYSTSSISLDSTSTFMLSSFIGDGQTALMVAAGSVAVPSGARWIMVNTSYTGSVLLQFASTTGGFPGFSASCVRVALATVLASSSSFTGIVPVVPPSVADCTSSYCTNTSSCIQLGAVAEFNSSTCSCTCATGGVGIHCSPTLSASAAFDSTLWTSLPTPPAPVTPNYLLDGATVVNTTLSLGTGAVSITIRNVVVSGPTAAIRVHLSVMQPRAAGTSAQVLVTNVTLLNGAVLYIVGSAGGPSYVHPNLVVNVSGVSMLNGALVLARSLPMGCTLLVEDINAISTTALAPVSPPFITSDPVRQGASLYFLGFTATDNASCLLRRINISTNITTSNSVMVIGTLLVSRNSSMTLHGWTLVCSLQSCFRTPVAGNGVEVRLSSTLFVDHWVASAPASVFGLHWLLVANSSQLVMRDVSAETPTLLLVFSGITSLINDGAMLMLVDVSITAFSAAVAASTPSVASLLHAGSGIVLTSQSILMLRNTGARVQAAAVNLGAGGSITSSRVVLMCNRFGRLMQDATLGGNYVLLGSSALSSTYVTVAACNNNNSCNDIGASCFPAATASVASSRNPIIGASCSCTCNPNNTANGELCLLRPLWYLDRIIRSVLSNTSSSGAATSLQQSGVVTSTLYVNRTSLGDVDIVTLSNVTIIGPARLVIDVGSLTYGAYGVNSSRPALVVNITNVTLISTSLSVLCSAMPLPNGRPMQLNIVGLQATESYIHFAGTPPPYSTITIVSSSTLTTGAAQTAMSSILAMIAPSLPTNVGVTTAAILLDAFGIVSGSTFVMSNTTIELPFGETAALAAQNDLWISRFSQFTVTANVHVAQHTLLATQSAILVEGTNSILLVQNHTHRPSGGGSIIRSLAVSVISSGYIVLRYV
ncbi:DGF-1-like protein, putative, partial [Bodo saltans]